MDNETLKSILIILSVYAVLIVQLSFLMIIDEKDRLIQKSVRGIRNILNTYDENEINITVLSKNIQLFYDEYMRFKPNAKKYFPNSIVWLDEIMVRINVGNSCVKLVKDSYISLKKVRDCLNLENPYSNCTEYQQGILSDINDLLTDNNTTIIRNILNRAENEFIRLNQEIKKNEKSNKLSLIIGIVGIVVSVFMAFVKL